MRLIMILSMILSIALGGLGFAKPSTQNALAKKVSSSKKITKTKKTAKKKSAKKKTQVAQKDKAKKKRMTEAERKALARKQVQRARKIAAERNAKEEAEAKKAQAFFVRDRVQPQPIVEVTGMKDDVIHVSETQASVGNAQVLTQDSSSSFQEPIVERDLTFSNESVESDEFSDYEFGDEDFD